MSVTSEVQAERKRQRSRWGAKHDRNHSWPDWHYLIGLRLSQVAPQFNKSGVIGRRRALVELAALAIAAIEANES
jgi:hypothetical protein